MLGWDGHNPGSSDCSDGNPTLLVRSVKQLLLWRWDASIPPMPVIPVARASRMPLSGFILHALFWVLMCPFGGEGEVVCDGVAEIAGDLSDEPSVEKIAFTHWIGRRSLRPAIRVGDLLWVRCRAFFANCEVDRVTGRRNPLPRTWVWTVCVPWLYCREVCRGSARLRGESAPPHRTQPLRISPEPCRWPMLQRSIRQEATLQATSKPSQLPDTHHVIWKTRTCDSSQGAYECNEAPPPAICGRTGPPV